ncbi:412L [Invertebrate iridescent virus Kaz2018]|uniref:412L n=1 Tax=Invertebrate iridescent virus 6 TaxID=176652 RepID=Q91FB3_IIV6|nr:412L [Invertebrate iridescent virus 6]AAK82272.1 412L [Invertebrate iridescent virus 6]QMS79679.1 hypothetical protein IIV6-T1_405 [Invertebrate iridescent virus 6]QNH08822.1 412L [Invertebrate iridescent virus Kaz2018]
MLYYINCTWQNMFILPLSLVIGKLNACFNYNNKNNHYNGKQK